MKEILPKDMKEEIVIVSSCLELKKATFKFVEFLRHSLSITKVVTLTEGIIINETLQFLLLQFIKCD